MPKKETNQDYVTIQFKVTTDEYASLQRAKADSGDPRQANSDFYRKKLLKSIYQK